MRRVSSRVVGLIFRGAVGLAVAGALTAAAVVAATLAPAEADKITSRAAAPVQVSTSAAVIAD